IVFVSFFLSFISPIYGKDISFKEEVENLLVKPPTYQPGYDGIERRFKDFPLDSKKLAFLFLSAVSEQYRFLSINAAGRSVVEANEMVFYHDANHFFDNSIREVFSYNRWIRLYFDLIP